MRSQIEKIKILMEVNTLISKTQGIDPAITLWLIEIYNLLVKSYGFDLSKTSPKKLYGKPYSDLTLEERAEYTQIKRNIRRGFSSEN